MSDSLWLDLGLFLLILLTGGLFVFMQAEPAADLELEGRRENTRSRWPLYPHTLIRQCGYAGQRSMLLYWAVKITFVVLVLAAILELNMSSLPWSAYLVAGLAAFFLCDIWLLIQRSSRRTAIELSLEFFVSLLIVFLKSGFSLSKAFAKAAEIGMEKNNPLAMELKLLASELDAGRDRERAFAMLAERTGVDALRRLAAVIQTGITIGTPVIEGLQSQLKLLRMQQQQQDTARINRKALATMVPMMMVCFPMFIVLIFFPAGVQMLDILAVLGDLL